LERSATTYVLPELRDVTRVWTFTLPNSVTRLCGIAWVKPRSSSAEGLSWTVRASTFNGVLLRQGSSRALGHARSDSILPKARRPKARIDGPAPPAPGNAPGTRQGTRKDPMDLSEDGLIKAVARLLSGSEPGVVIGLGDDAAVVEPGAGQLVLTTDLLANDVEAAWVMGLVGGMRDSCAEYALALVGGDTNRADLVVVSVAVVGEVVPGRAVLGSRARAGPRPL